MEEIKKNTYWQRAIREKIRISPNCRKKQGGGKLKFIIIGAVMAISLTTFSGCGNNKSEPANTDQAQDGQKDALSSAKDYLAYSILSYSGLIKQLKLDKFSMEDATYAADHCEADWNEQAALRAQQYIDHSPISRSRLIKQLEFDGFTKDQIEYGIKAVGY